MGEKMSVSSKLLSDMHFQAEAGSGHTVHMDAAVGGGGQDLGFRPMELLLVGLSGCTGMDVISILRKKREKVTGYEVQVHAERAEDYPMVFTDITVEHIVTGYHLSPDAVARAIELSETRYCGAGAMLGRTARLKHAYRLVQLEAEPVTHP